MERLELDRYVEARSLRLQLIFRECDLLVDMTDDTLDDDFQIAAEIVKLFERYAARNLENLNGPTPKT